MSHDSILKNVAKHIDLDEKEVEIFKSLIAHKKVNKKTIILNEGDACQYLSYVHSGTLRAFHVDKTGKESTIMFAISDWWITDMYCFLNEKSAITSIETIEESSLWQISKKNFDELFVKIPKFERFFRILMQNSYTREQLRIIDNLSLSAEEKYDNFLRKYPQIVSQITQKQLASYLGISPEFLSVIRKKKTKNLSLKNP